MWLLNDARVLKREQGRASGDLCEFCGASFQRSPRFTVTSI